MQLVKQKSLIYLSKVWLDITLTVQETIAAASLSYQQTNRKQTQSD